MKQNVCRKNKFGYCMYGDTCRNRHIEEICSSKNCNVFNCEKRHPKICNYFKEFERCKFTTFCRYSHRKPKEVLENDKRIQAIEDKLLEIEKKGMNSEESIILKKLEVSEQEFEEEK